MKEATAITSAASEFLLAINALNDRKERILIGSGCAGYGKTTMLLLAKLRTNGVLITANASWTVKWMLSDLCDQLSIRRSGSVQQMFEDCTQQLKLNGRTIYLDEANLLVEGRDFKSVLLVLSMLYRIHDEAGVGIVIFGLSSFPRYVEERASRSEAIRAFTQRCVRWLEFKAIGFEDAKLIAQKRLEVPIDDETVRGIVAKSRGNVRELITLLTEFERSEKAKVKV